LRDKLASASDPFDMGLRLAVAGNVIDFGAQHLLDPAETIQRVLTADLAIDHGEQLREDLARARSVLYIGDNAGEIVLDALFLEILARPGLTFVVRGGPVINDDDSPGVILPRVSPEFRTAFDKADVVIAKGQGNLEGLWDAPRDVYFLLTVKCERIARQIGVPVGAFVVWGH
jgi:uncharacterized protein with ATP-grasp and redox domains